MAFSLLSEGLCFDIRARERCPLPGLPREHPGMAVLWCRRTVSELGLGLRAQGPPHEREHREAQRDSRCSEPPAADSEPASSGSFREWPGGGETVWEAVASACSWWRVGEPATRRRHCTRGTSVRPGAAAACPELACSLHAGPRSWSSLAYRRQRHCRAALLRPSVNRHRKCSHNTETEERQCPVGGA